MENGSTRRHFLAAASGAVAIWGPAEWSTSPTAWASGLGQSQFGNYSTEIYEGSLASPARGDHKRKRIVKVHLGKEILCPDSKGDTWTATWADDDNLYAISDDTWGLNRACDSNLAVHRIMGGPPPNIQGVAVNAMSEFGKRGEYKGDGASWKACSVICVDGTLYVSASRHSDLIERMFWIQEHGTPALSNRRTTARYGVQPPELGHARYNPSIPSKFIEEDGRQFWIFTSGISEVGAITTCT